MLKDKYLIWNKEEYNYPRAFGFIPNLMSYIHEDEVERPCMIVIPGGSYCMAVPTEGEVVALEFYERGYNTFVLTYTTNRLFDIPLKLQPLKDVSRAIRFVRKNKESFHIKEDQLVVCGFSAGGHLAGSICVHYNDVEDENEEYKRISNRPDAGILSYPVITMGEYTHFGSMHLRTGEDKELINKLSTEIASAANLSSSVSSLCGKNTFTIKPIAITFIINPNANPKIGTNVIPYNIELIKASNK